LNAVLIECDSVFKLGQISLRECVGANVRYLVYMHKRVHDIDRYVCYVIQQLCLITHPQQISFKMY